MNIRNRLRRLERLEADTRAAARPGEIDFGACLTAGEWQRVLSPLDPDPNRAFAIATSEEVPAVVMIIGGMDRPKTFAELAENTDPRSHLWTAKMAAYALAFGGQKITVATKVEREIAGALERMFPGGGSSPAERALYEAAAGIRGLLAIERVLIDVEFVSTDDGRVDLKRLTDAELERLEGILSEDERRDAIR